MSSSQNINNKQYKLSFTAGGLYVNESLELARIYLELQDWKLSISQVISDGLIQLPKEASKRRILREIATRLKKLSQDELNYLINDADRREQSHILWLASCRAYRLIREFAVEILNERYQTYNLELPVRTFEHFLEEKAELSDSLSTTTKLTRGKLRQVVFRIMREAGIISDDNCIQTAWLSRKLRTMLEETAPFDLAIFPGMTAGDRP